MEAYVLTGKHIHEARCIFMHAHTVSSIEKFMARLSLILSKTTTLEIDLAYVDISTIEDIKCQNKDGSIAHKEDGEPLIHTDGTGFVSEDIALRCPKCLYKGAQKNHETYLGNVDADNHDSDLHIHDSDLHIREPVRLFFYGCAIKGTLLVNRKLPVRTIQIRPSMIKVEQDYNIQGIHSANSLEIVTTSDEGQVSGKVLVYRHPGIHFGDVHILTAIYVEDMETYIGNAKYAILFPTKRHRSLADEMAGGDFDGDMFFVSRNPQVILCISIFFNTVAIFWSQYSPGLLGYTFILLQLLRWFTPSEPWTQKASQRISAKKKPSELSVDDLEHELFQLFLTTRFNPSTAAGIAADSWLSFMDRLLVLGDDSCDEKICVKKKMLRLVDIYYDALDAPKLGSKVTVPSGLEAKIFPHYMGRENIYRSMSIIGQIYDAVDSFKPQVTRVSDVWTMSCFEVDVPESCSMKWKLHYEEYRKKMSDALRLDAESKNETAEAVIMDYKQIIYGAKTFGQRTREDTEIFNDALAIYQISYSFAKREQTVSKCSFPWKIAGEALMKLYLLKRGERPLTVSLPVAKEIFY